MIPYRCSMCNGETDTAGRCVRCTNLAQMTGAGVSIDDGWKVTARSKGKLGRCKECGSLKVWHSEKFPGGPYDKATCMDCGAEHVKNG